MKAGLTERSL